MKENLPEAEITFDKFHILKIINEGVDKVRREESKSNPLLKGNRYLLDLLQNSIYNGHISIKINKSTNKHHS